LVNEGTGNSRSVRMGDGCPRGNGLPQGSKEIEMTKNAKKKIVRVNIPKLM
jgi:hypothetical protein